MGFEYAIAVLEVATGEIRIRKARYSKHDEAMTWARTLAEDTTPDYVYWVVVTKERRS